MSVREFELATGHEVGSLSKRFSELYCWKMLRSVSVDSRGKRIYSLSDFGYNYITELYQYGKV